MHPRQPYETGSQSGVRSFIMLTHFVQELINTGTEHRSELIVSCTHTFEGDGADALRFSNQHLLLHYLPIEVMSEREPV